MTVPFSAQVLLHNIEALASNTEISYRGINASVVR
jgi:hypothetical protein